MKDLNLVATYNGEYTTDEGILKHIYLLDGNAESLALYKKERGSYYREDSDTGKPVFTARSEHYVADVVRLRYAPKTKVKFFIDSTEFNKSVAKVVRTCKASGVDPADVIAKMFAPPSITTEVSAPVEESVEESAEDLADI